MKQQNQQLILERGNELQQQKRASQHLEDYLNYFSDINADLLSRNHLIEQLQSNGNIKQTDCNEEQYFKISVFNYTSTFQIINVEIQYGPFLIPIAIYNVQESSLVHYLDTISTSAANIYAYQQGGKEQAIKCFPIKKQSFEESFIGALKEYCIFKIAATLNIGPHLSKLCGFDLIVFSQCIQFCMEKGVSLKNAGNIQNCKKKFLNLKKKLRVLHLLNIVHMDIKPTNICMEQREGHFMFIDFGFSNVIFQELGSKSLVCFFGSLNYCCQEMLNIYNTGQSQLVDLYFNDAYALRKVEQQIFSASEQEEGASSKYELYELGYQQKFAFRIDHKLQEFYKLARLKYLFFSSSPLIKTNQIIEIFLQNRKPLIKFTKSLPYSRLLEEFYGLLNEKNQDSYNEDVLKSTVQDYLSLKEGVGVGLDSPLVAERYSATLKGIHIKRRDIINVNLNYTKEMGLKEIVSSPQIAKDLKKNVYFQKYVAFVNFKVGLSRFQEKIEASKVMCQVLGITPTKSNYYDMEVSYLICCLKFLLQYYLAEEGRSCVESLPIIFGNLLILEELSETEIVSMITKIFKKKLPLTDYTNISVKIFLSLYWILEQTSSRYRMRSLTSTCLNTIQRHLREIKTQNESEKTHIKGIASLLTLDYVIVSTQQLQIFEVFALQKIPLISKQIKREINLYISTITMKLYFNGENSKKIINCIKLISEQDNIFKSPHFQYYHFKMFYFFFYTHNIRAMESMMKKFEICMGSTILTSKYYISDLYQSQMYIIRNKNNPSFYIDLIKALEQDPMDLNKRIVFKTFHLFRLSKIDQNHLDIQIKEFITTIQALLRETFPLKGLLDFDRIYNYYGDYVKNFGQWCYNYVSILGSIYRNDENMLKYLKHFEDRIKVFSECMSCQCCRQRFDSSIIIISAFRLQLEGEYEEIIKIYKEYAFKESFLHLNHFKLLSILDILRFTIKIPSLNHRIEESVNLFCEWMTKKDAWLQSFNIIAKSTQAFEVTNRYFFMKRQFAEYFKVQQKFLQSIVEYPTKEYIISYCSSFIQFLSQFPMSQDMIIQQFKFLKVVERNKNPYFALNASIVLIFCPLADDDLPQRIIHSIYSSIPRIITFAKYITRGHLFYYLAKQSIFLLASQQKQEKTRKLLFKIKMYTKSSIHDLTFAEFKINYSNGRRIKKNNERVHNSYEIKLSKYFSLIKRSKDEEINLLNFPYSSPFCAQAQRSAVF